MFIFLRTFAVLPTRAMSKKTVYGAPERNKKYILKVLQEYIKPDQQGDVLEISSGTGQHVSYFARHFPNLNFQPSEYDDRLMPSIKAYIEEAPSSNIKDPVKIDITTDHKTWGLAIEKYDYLININLMHISPFECTLGLFNNCAKILKPGGLMITYGPYANDGVIEPQSNVDFDMGLRAEDPRWGLRDIKDLKRIGNESGIEFVAKHDLPANNKCLVWKKNNK